VTVAEHFKEQFQRNLADKFLREFQKYPEELVLYAFNKVQTNAWHLAQFHRGISEATTQELCDQVGIAIRTRVKKLQRKERRATQ
jgi:hypothetical protein